MIIIELYGGLGNQLFEYAHAKALAKQLKQDVYFDLSFFDNYHRKDVYRLDKFNTTVEIADDSIIKKLKRKSRNSSYFFRAFTKLFGFEYYNKKYHFDNNRIDKCSIEELSKIRDFYVSGYYADSKYFEPAKEQLKKDIILKDGFNKENQIVYHEIRSKGSVSVHVRRGDYIGNRYFNELTIDYYQNSLNYILKIYSDVVFYVFSDDLQWVKSNLIFNCDVKFVDINSEISDYMDLMLMAACDHNIIANSTFSWWGAWLNSNPDKIVIAPKIWYTNKKAQNSYESGNRINSNWIKI